MTYTEGMKTGVGQVEARVKELEVQLKRYQDTEADVKEHLKRFDELDFEVFNKQDWKRLERIHSEDVRVVYPDGHETRGVKKYAEDLAAMFAWLPDFRITSHAVSFGSGEWIAVIGVVEGTFTRPMRTGDGKTVPPNNRKVKLQMVTVAHWKDDRIIEEYLFWDNAAFMQQLGLAAGEASQEREAAGVGNR